nr:MAG TPA: hypothetical protein [Caudoviricetes sp.]
MQISFTNDSYAILIISLLYLLILYKILYSI